MALPTSVLLVLILLSLLAVGVWYLTIASPHMSEMEIHLGAFQENLLSVYYETAAVGGQVRTLLS